MTAGKCADTNAAGISERTNAWLGQFRRLLVRHDHLLSIYRAFYVACMWIALRKCL